MSLLDDAEESLRGGERLAALDALLAAWRAERVPAIADVIDVVSADVARAIGAIPLGSTQKATSQRWHDICERGRAADVPRLLALVATEDLTTSAVKLQLERLAQRFPDDPRVAKRLTAVLCGGFRWAPKPMWPLLLRMLLALRDVRGLERVRAHRKQSETSRPRTPVFYQDIWKRMDALIVALDAPPPPLDGASLATLARIAVRARQLAAGPPPALDAVEAHAPPPPPPTGRDESQLLALVWAAPDDVNARLVYADALSERGAPLGEYIALANKPSPMKKDETRMRSLLRTHLAEWLGPLEPVVVAKTARFERGFLAACTTRFSSPEQRAQLAAHPAWSTLHEVATDEPRVVQTAKSLRALHDAKQGLLRQLCAGPPVSVETVSMRLTAVLNDAVRDGLASMRTFPRLTTMHCSLTRAISLDVDNWLWLLPAVGALRRFSLVKDAGYRELLQLAAWLPHVPPTLTVELDISTFAVTITHGKRGFCLDVIARQLGANFGLLPALDELDPRSIERINVKLGRFNEEMVSELDARLSRFAGSWEPLDATA